MMSYRESFAAFGKTARHKRLVFMVTIVAILHLIGNVIIVNWGQEAALYSSDPELHRATLGYWVAFTIVFWLVVYLLCRFIFPLFVARSRRTE